MGRFEWFHCRIGWIVEDHTCLVQGICKDTEDDLQLFEEICKDVNSVPLKLQNSL